jgi:hypothetical protein
LAVQCIRGENGQDPVEILKKRFGISDGDLQLFIGIVKFVQDVAGFGKANWRFLIRCLENYRVE